jgi:hypothetical protein
MSNTPEYDENRRKRDLENLQEQLGAEVVDAEMLHYHEKLFEIEPNDTNKFALATLYIKTRDPGYIEPAFKLLKDLIQQQASTSFDAYESNSRHYKRDCMYLMALGYLHLGEFPSARRWLERLLDFDNGNYQALRLLDLVDLRIREEGTKGLAIAGGALAVGLGTAAAIGGIFIYNIFKK